MPGAPTVYALRNTKDELLPEISPFIPKKLQRTFSRHPEIENWIDDLLIIYSGFVY